MKKFFSTVFKILKVVFLPHLELKRQKNILNEKKRAIAELDKYSYKKVEGEWTAIKKIEICVIQVFVLFEKDKGLVLRYKLVDTISHLVIHKSLKPTYFSEPDVVKKLTLDLEKQIQYYMANRKNYF